MKFIRSILGPKSKYNKDLPYTYMAKIYALNNDKETSTSHFSDTICGLIDYLDENDINPETVKLFGIYRKKNIPLNIEYCISSSGRWLERPFICRSLENHYNETLKECYKGHRADGDCDFDDRDRDVN